MSKSYKYKIYIVFGEEKLILTSNGRSTIYEIKRAISQRFEVPVSNLELRIGPALKQIEMPDSTLLRNTGIESGETITVLYKSDFSEESEESSPETSPRFEQIPDSDGLIMIRRVIPADNSCLFSAIGYAVEEKNRYCAGYLREIVASYIASDPEKYNELVLEKSNQDYQEWILDDRNWGGAIEAEILASHYEMEICIVDIRSSSVASFGSDSNYKKRIYILYDGAHYDVVARNISEDMEEETDITIFSPRDKYALEGTLMLAKELNFHKNSMKIESCGSQEEEESLSNEGSEEKEEVPAQNCYQQAGQFDSSKQLNSLNPLK